MGTRWRNAAVVYLVVVLTVAFLVTVESGAAAVRQPSTVDTRLVGKWTRTVTSADAKRARGLTLFAGHVFTLTITKSGSWKASTPNLGAFGEADGTIVPAGPNRVRLVEGGSGGLYSWRVSGRLLTFTKLKDSVSDRVMVFWGSWARKG